MSAEQPEKLTIRERLHHHLDNIADGNGEVRATNRELADGLELGLTPAARVETINRALTDLVRLEQVRKEYEPNTKVRVIVLL